jgi:GPH family glycoside/pentoside/hexuronide:cation symporter
MSTESTTNKPFKPDKVSRGKMASYGMGPFANSFIEVGYNYIVFYYFQVELGLATALVGLSFVIYAIWNMLNDPLVGYLTDKPNRFSKKYGLRTPWIIFAGICQAVLWFFLFWIPFDISDVKSNPWPLFWYMILITCLWDTAFSLFTTHYIGGFANIFRTPDDRRKASTMMLVVGIFGRTFALGLVLPFMIIVGDPSSYVRAALVCTIILLISLLAFLPGIHENEFVKKRYLQIYEFLESQKMGYIKTLKIAFKQKNWLLWTVVYTLYVIGMMLNQVSTIYFLVDVLGLPFTVLALISVALLASLIPGIFIWSWVAKKTAHSNLVIASFFILSFVNIFTFFFVTDLTTLLIANFIAGFGAGAWLCIIFSISADTNDEVTNAAGRHVEATMVGIRNFFFRIAYLAIGIIVAGVQIATGYQPGAAEQTDLAKLGIRIHNNLIPALFMLTAAILMLKFYDLKGDKKIAQMESLRKKGL